MRTESVSDFASWREAARACLVESVPPGRVRFVPPGGQPMLDLELPPENVEDVTSGRRDREGGVATAASAVPKAFLDLARGLSCHRDSDRFDLLYRMLWRITRGHRLLLEDHADPDRQRAHRMERQIARAVHKTKAFVRFRKIAVDEVGDLRPEAAAKLSNPHDRYIAWHRPEHPVLPLVAGFLSRRFTDMHWTVLTPDESMTWDGEAITFGPGVPRSEAPSEDELEPLWKRYYASVFNPARVNEVCMRREMPQHHWATLPEADLIPELVRQAHERTDRMVSHTEGSAVSAADFIPETHELDQLAAASQFCEGCTLYRNATQTVFGVGPESARVVFVGEQPGDREDLAGQPFVGPAGQLLNEQLEAAGIDRQEVYITNVVKHFKWEPQGKRRLHKKPSAREMTACKPWLERELDVIGPEVLVCLGATAAQALIGRDFRITKQRGEWISTDWCDRTIATYHPAALLRAPDDEARERMLGMFAEDLVTIRTVLDES